MAGSKFQYDESGGTFFYFLLAFLVIVVVPCTYYFWPKDPKKGEVKRDRKQCHCEQCAIKASYLRSKEPWRKTKRRLIKFSLIIGWAALIACAYKVAHLQHDYIIYDPFEILGLDPGATTAQIKRAYRQKSLIYHPDKETGDEKKFIQIKKAYEALTDEEAKKNWETYGNPDGPGPMVFGIALPAWIVEKENSIIVLGIYALVFMVALPVGVGIWWYNSVKFGGDQVLIDTTQLYFYFIHKSPQMALKRVIMILAASLEFERNHNSEIIERPSDNKEVPQLMKDLPNLGEKNREKPLCYGHSLKARALLHAHLGRMKLPPNTLEVDKNYIVRKCPYLLQEFVQCISQLTMLALAGRIARTPKLETLEHAMKLCSLIVQAIWDNKNSLLQLPHVNEDLLRHFTNKKRNVKTIKQLAQMKNSERRGMLRNLTDEQYEDVMNVISKMPLLDIEVRSEVLDDDDAGNITAGAIVTVTVTLIRQDMSTLFDQENAEFEKLEGEQQDETEPLLNGDTPNGNIQNSPQIKKPKVWEKPNKGKKKGGKAKQKKKAQQANKKKPQQNQGQKPPASNDQLVKSSNKQKTDDDESNLDDKSDNESEVNGSESDGGKVDKKSNDENKKSKVNESKNDDYSEGEEDDEWEKFQQKVNKKEKVLETKSKQSHSVHCPYFPDDKQEYWWIYIADRKRHALMTIPYLMTNLVDREEVELKFTAPIKPGIYSYSVIVRSDSYVDFDLSKSIRLDVKEAPKEVDTHPQWDISEEEEEVNKDEDSAVEDSDLVLSSDDTDSESEA